MWPRWQVAVGTPEQAGWSESVPQEPREWTQDTSLCLSPEEEMKPGAGRVLIGGREGEGRKGRREGEGGGREEEGGREILRSSQCREPWLSGGLPAPGSGPLLPNEHRIPVLEAPCAPRQPLNLPVCVTLSTPSSRMTSSTWSKNYSPHPWGPPHIRYRETLRYLHLPRGGFLWIRFPWDFSPISESWPQDHTESTTRCVRVPQRRRPSSLS